MIAITRRFKFRTIIALIVISILINLYFYFFNQQYLSYILFFILFFMVLSAIICYLNFKRFKKNSLGRVWMLFAIGFFIWIFTNSIPVIDIFFYQGLAFFATWLFVIDIFGYFAFAYANFQLAKFTDLIKTGKPKVPLMKLALILTIISLIFLVITLAYFNLIYGQFQYLFAVYLLANILITGSLVFLLFSLKNLSIQRPFAFFIFGFIVLVIIESSFIFFVLSGIYKSFFTGSFQDFLYIIAFGAFALGAYDQKRQLS